MPKLAAVQRQLESLGLTVCDPSGSLTSKVIDLVAIGTAQSLHPVSLQPLGEARALAILVDRPGGEPDDFDFGERIDVARAHGMEPYRVVRERSGRVTLETA